MSKDIPIRVLIAFYKAYAPEKSEQDAHRVVASGMSLKELNEKLKAKYGADLSVVSPMSPQMARNPSDLQTEAKGLPASVTLEKNLVIVRKGELVDFYSYHTPERENIEDHVDGLFDKYSWDGIKEALMTKYGCLPPGWSLV